MLRTFCATLVIGSLGIPAFAQSPSPPILTTADPVRCPVTRKTEKDLSELIGQNVVLSVHMTKGCVLYSFSFSE